jgi:hypothetical protein
MAITVINLSDPVSTWVSKTNTVASNLGDLTLLTIGGSDIVTAINRVDSNIGTLSSLVTDDKSDIVSAINEVAGSADSVAVRSLFYSSDSSIAYDSSLGGIEVASSGIKSSKFNAVQTLLIKNSSGVVVKTMYSPGN